MLSKFPTKLLDFIKEQHRKVFKKCEKFVSEIGCHAKDGFYHLKSHDKNNVLMHCNVLYITETEK